MNFPREKKRLQPLHRRHEGVDRVGYHAMLNTGIAGSG